MTRAIYPGSFDPVTNGHLDIVERAAKLFDEVIVAVSINIKKDPMFSFEERVEMLSEACGHLPNVTIDGYKGLTVAYAKSRDAQVVVRGLRALSDFQYEFEMALMNRRLDESIETVFLMPSAEYSYLCSSLAKEVSGFGGSIKGLVPEAVEERLLRKLAARSGEV